MRRVHDRKQAISPIGNPILIVCARNAIVRFRYDAITFSYYLFKKGYFLHPIHHIFFIITGAGTVPTSRPRSRNLVPTGKPESRISREKTACTGFIKYAVNTRQGEWQPGGRLNYTPVVCTKQKSVVVFGDDGNQWRQRGT